MNHSAELSLAAQTTEENKAESSAALIEHAHAILNFTKILKSAMHNTFVYVTSWWTHLNHNLLDAWLREYCIIVAGDGRGGEEGRVGETLNGCMITPVLFSYIPILTSITVTVRYGQGTRDMAGPSGLTTEAFINKVRHSMLCYAIVCNAMMWCDVMWCAVMCCAVLCCAVLCCAVLCCAVLQHGMLWYDVVRYGMVWSNLPYHALSYLTLPYLTLPYLTLPYLTLPYLTLPYITLPCLGLQVAWRLGRYVAAGVEEVAPGSLLMPSLKFRRNCTLKLFCSVYLASYCPCLILSGLIVHFSFFTINLRQCGPGGVRRSI